jgi:hypothetical protein
LNGVSHHRDTEAQRKTGHIVTEYTENCNNPSFSGLTGESRGFSLSEKTTILDTPVKPEYDSEEAKASDDIPQYETVRLDPDTPDNLPRVPMLPGGNIPVPADGRWVRVETPDGPMAIRRLDPQWPPPEPEYYVDDDVWEDDFWDGDWDWDDDP